MRFTFLPYRTTVPGLTPTIDKIGDGQPAINIPDRRMWLCVNGQLVEVTNIQQLIECWITVIDATKERTQREAAEHEASRINRLKAFIRALMP